MKRPPLQVPTRDVTEHRADTTKVLERDRERTPTLLGWARSLALFVFLWLDLHFFARGREPSFREAVVLVGRLARVVAAGGDSGAGCSRAARTRSLYTTVYLIERSLSLDNLFVFLLLFAYFGVPYERRPRLLFWGIVAALALRGVFILARHAR